MDIAYIENVKAMSRRRKVKGTPRKSKELRRRIVRGSEGDDMTFTLNLPQLIEVYLLGVATVTTILLAIQVIKK